MTLTILKSTALIGALLAITACASSPQERGPERGDRGPRGEEGARKGPRTDSPAVAGYPIGLVFASMDSDGDGATSRAELAAGTAKHWGSFDGQTRLSAVYFAKWSERELGSVDAMPNFFAFDRDFSSTVTQDEFEARLSEEFTRLDKDGNGRLTRQEMLFTIASQRGRGQGSEGAQGGRGQGGRGQGGGGRGQGRGGGGR